MEGVDVCLETSIFWVRLLISQCGEEVRALCGSPAGLSGT